MPARAVPEDVIAALDKENLRDSVKVLIGGAPVSPEYAEEIGAGGFAPDAVVATDMCKQIVN